MTFLEVGITAAVFATLLMIFVYSYLYYEYRERHLGKWTIAWVVHAIRVIFLEQAIAQAGQPAEIILYIGCSLVYSFFLMWGTFDFLQRPFGQPVRYCALGAFILSGVGAVAELPIQIYGIPSVLFISWAYIQSGRALWGGPHRGMGKTSTAIALILLGIHTLDLPFLIHITWFAPWGYLIDAILRFVVAIGIILFYYEEAKSDLMATASRYRLLAEHAFDVVYRYRIIEPCGFEYVSPAVQVVTGYTPADFYAHCDFLDQIIHREDRPLLPTRETAKYYTTAPVTLRLIRQDQTEIWTEHTITPIFEEDKLVAFEGIFRDIHEQKSLERDMYRLDGLNSIGQMAANVAHEIRNPMTTVRGYLQFLGAKQQFQGYTEQFALMLGELDRANALISEYLSLGHKRASEFSTGQLNQVIEALFPLLQADATCSSKYVKLNLGDIEAFCFDEKEIRQLILNVTRNGLEAMLPGKSLEIRTFADGDEIVLAIKDEGCGIPRNILDGLGKPFITTKQNGTGLGMAVCQRIVHHHGAKMLIETGNAGTTVFVRFHPDGMVQTARSLPYDA